MNRNHHPSRLQMEVEGEAAQSREDRTRNAWFEPWRYEGNVYKLPRSLSTISLALPGITVPNASMQRLVQEITFCWPFSQNPLEGWVLV